MPTGEIPAGVAPGDVTDHLADTTDAHDASAVSVADAGGYYTGTNVETVLAELPAKFAPITASVASARNGDGILYIAHRGGPLLHPEHTMTAYRTIVAQGCRVIEQDCHLLLDGSLGVMHDATIDATTTGTGNTADQTAASWRGLVNDAGASLGGVYTSKTYDQPLFDDVVVEFGNKVVLAVEAKTVFSGAAIVARLQALGVATDAAIVCSFFLSELYAARAAGYTTQYLGTAETPATLAAESIDQIAVEKATSSATISTYLSAGLEVLAYTVNSQTERDTLLGYGVTGFYSDDPIYLADEHPILTASPFSAGTWYHGMTKHGSVRGGWSGGAYCLLDQSYQFSGAGQGWASPLTTPDAVVIDVAVTFVTENGANRWFCVDLMTADTPSPTSAAFATGNTGYRFLCRKNGIVQIYRVNSSASTLIGTGGGTVTAIADGGTASYRITVTATTVTLERVDVANSTGAVSDATYRDCKYVAIGGSFAVTHIRSIAIS